MIILNQSITLLNPKKLNIGLQSIKEILQVLHLLKQNRCSYQNFFKEQTSSLPDSAHKGPNSNTSTKERPLVQREKHSLVSTNNTAQPSSEEEDASLSSSVLSLSSSPRHEVSSDGHDKPSVSEECKSQREFPTVCFTQNIVGTCESIPCCGSHAFDPSNPTNSAGSHNSKRKCRPIQKV